MSEDPDEMRDEMIPNNQAFWEIREILARRLMWVSSNSLDSTTGECEGAHSLSKRRVPTCASQMSISVP